MSAVSGLLSSASAQTNDLVGEFQETIFVRNAKGLNVGSTLFGLMAKLKTEPADNIEFNWFERNPVTRTIFSSLAEGTGALGTLSFDNGKGTTVTQLLAAGHILRNDRTGEYVRVTSDPDPSGFTVTVLRDVANLDGDLATSDYATGGIVAATGTNPITGQAYDVLGASVLLGDSWTIITLGKDEGADPTRGSYEDPETLINYIQTYNSTVHLTNAFKGQVLRSDIEGPLTDRRIQALEKIARDIEMSYLMGRKRRLTGTNGYVYLTGGLYDSLLKNAPGNILDGKGGTSLAPGPYVTLAEFNDWMETFMTYGSDAKLAFCGPRAYTCISTFANSAANGYRIMQGEQVFGMHITTINTPFGELSLAYHPLLKEAVAFNSWMYVVDLPMVVQKTFEPLFLEPDIQIPGQDAYKEQYRAKLGLKLKFANAFGVAHDLTKIVA